MWASTEITIETGRTVKVAVLCDGIPVSYRQVIDHWRTDKYFRQFFIGLLAKAPFAAYFFETPPVNEVTADQSFEFVLVGSPQLADVRADAQAFADHFKSTCSNDDVVAFPNLSGDALLVAPCPRAFCAGYPHLAAFSRNAPLPQQHALWRRVGQLVTQRVDEHPLWVSTSGLGVYWLHIRLDSDPKYYTFEPYRAA